MIEDEEMPAIPSQKKRTAQTKEESAMPLPVETAPVREEPQVNVGTYCAIGKHPYGTQNRLMIFSMEQNGGTRINPDEEKTLAEWEALYTNAMNQK